MKREEIDMKEKAISTKLVVFAVVFISCCLIVPIWQSAVSTSLTLKINSLNTEIIALGNQTSQVKAQIANLTDPDNIVRLASTQNTGIVASSI